MYIYIIYTCVFTDFLWLNENVLLSCSKDCKLVQQLMVHADRPADKAVSLGEGLHGVASLETVMSCTNVHVWPKHSMRVCVYTVKKEANVLGTSGFVLLAVSKTN